MNRNIALGKDPRHPVNIRLLAFIYTVVSFFLFFVQCNPNIAGTGSQAGNGRIACVIYNDNGTPASGATVRLRSHNFTTDSTSQLKSATSRDTRTDKHGSFNIDRIDTGSYYIEVNDGRSHAVLLKCDINKNDTFAHIPNAILLPTSTITGSFTSVPNNSPLIYVQIYGLERTGVFNAETGNFVINDVPSGSYSIKIQTTSTSYKPVIINDIQTAPAQTSDIGKIDIIHLSQWQYSKRLYLNTSTTGANVAGTVTDFPVLVRLRTNNFDFSQAKADGSDLRFVKINGTQLPYEIERYDSSGSAADIWVKMDTVYGNNSTQFITLYSGNSTTIDSSNSSDVFDTTDNITAVWHLNKNCKDATYGDHQSVAASATDTLGLIGFCKKFDGSDSIKIAGLLGSPSSITLSAWTQLNTVSGSAGDIISLGDAVLIREDYTLDSLGTLGTTHLSNSSVYVNVASHRFLKGNTWHFIVFTFDLATFTPILYIDGVKVATRTDQNTAINYTGVGQNTYIGKHGNGRSGYGFCGRIDEVRVYRTAITADYIKLSFANQKAADALIVFK